MSYLILDEQVKRKTQEERAEISRRTIERFRQETGSVEVHFCRWCLSARVLSKGDVCHICADGVEELGLAFKTDEGFPWARTAIVAVTAIIVLLIFRAAAAV